MHERAMVADVVCEAEAICLEHGARAVRLRLTIGALSGADQGAVTGHFGELVGPGSPLAGAALDIATSDDPIASGALTLSLDAVTLIEA